MQQLAEVLKHFCDDVGPVFYAAGIVGPDGMPISDIVFSSSFNSRKGVSGGTRVMLKGREMAQALGLGEMEELIMTSSMGIFMSADLGNSYTLMVGVAKRATLGALRLLIAEYKPSLINACPAAERQKTG